MRRLKRIIKKSENVIAIVTVVFCIFMHIFELLGLDFMEKLFHKIGIMHPLRFCYIFTFILLAVTLIVDKIVDKIDCGY